MSLLEPAVRGAREPGTERVLLADGTPIEVRNLHYADATALTRLHGDLPPGDRWLRFHSASERGMDDYCRRSAEEGSVWGAFQGAEMVGAVHLARLPEDEGTAEVALAVEHRMQGHGVGTALLERAVAESHAMGILRWIAEVLSENAPMLRVFAELGLPHRFHRDGPSTTVTCELGDREPDEVFVAARLDRAVAAERAGLEPVLRPRSVAVVGAGRHAGSVGRAVLDSLMASGFRDHLAAVNPRARTIGPVRCVPRVTDLPEAPDLAVLCTPPATLPAIAEDCGRRGVRALLVLTSGLVEAGVDGALLDAVRRHGMRMVGPNCLGVANTVPDVRLDATFARGAVPAGTVGLATQSGGVAIAVLEALRGLGLGVSSMVSVGDRYDVSSNDLMLWWAGDETTRVAVLHVESFGNPRAFSGLARRLATRMPVLAVRTASTEVGARAAASHTAASATSAVRRDALYRQAGVLPVNDLGELTGALAALSWSRPMSGDRVAILGNAGGANVLAADACVAGGLQVRPLPEAARTRLAELLPGTATLANPVDTTATVEPATFTSCMQILRETPGIDAVLVVSCPTALGTPDADLAEVLADSASDIPVVAVALDQRARIAPLRRTTGMTTAEASEPLAACFADPADAARALGHLARRGAHLLRDPGRPLSPEEYPVDTDAAIRLVAQVLRDDPSGAWLSPAQCTALMVSAGLPLVPTRVVASADEAVALARELGGPVALKAVAEGVLHKSERGGVRLGLADEASVRGTVEEFTHIFGADLRGMAVQPMVPAGVEMLVGVTGDHDFGALVTAGVGGTGTDLADRRWHRLLPLSTTDLGDLLDDLPLSRGIAGRLVDRGRLADVLARVARLAHLVPQVAEMDLNPVVCTPRSCVVVDARIRVAPLAGSSVPPSSA